MFKTTWRNAVLGTASILCAAGFVAQASADQGSDEPILQTIVLEDGQVLEPSLSGPLSSEVLNEGSGTPVQVAQGVTGYEIPERRADRPRRGETVAGRARPDYDPLGARVGSFILFPELNVEERYESNIFATPNNEEDDFITRIMPSVSLESDWGNHELQLNGGAAIGIHADNTDEDFEDYFLGASGRVDIRRSTNLRIRTRYRRLHEDRESPDDANTGGALVAAEPTEFDNYMAGADLRHDFGRVNATVGGSFERISFEDPDAIGGGEVIEHDRDRNIYEGTLRLGYRIQPRYEAFVRGSYNVREYDGLDAVTGVDRDSDGYGVVAGLDVDFGGLLFGDFFVGYRYQDYEDPTLNSVSGIGGGADLTWTVTGLTTVTGSLLSDIRETTNTAGGASGRLVSTARLGVDHELRRNILLGADIGLTRDDFEGINRTDWIYQAGLDATYLINRNLHAGVDYNFRQRDADVPTSDFTNHVFLVRLGLQY